MASRNSEADPPDPADPPETQHAVRNRPWVPHAGGQDDGSYTNSLKLGSRQLSGTRRISGTSQVSGTRQVSYT